MRLLILSVSVLLTACIAEAAPTVTAQELLENPEKYDGKTVIYQGEAIGDIMLRQGGAWINVQDKTASLGVFCPKDEVAKIKYTGSYKFSGDIISVRGVFHHFCSQHGGDTDIHAKKITLIREGKEVSHPLEPQKVKLSVVLVVIAIILAIVHLLIRKLR